MGIAFRKYWVRPLNDTHYSVNDEIRQRFKIAKFSSFNQLSLLLCDLTLVKVNVRNLNMALIEIRNRKKIKVVQLEEFPNAIPDL